MNKPRFIVVHCSDSEFGDSDLIEKWHQERGFRTIGYHRVILNGRRFTARRYNPGCDGLVELGRHDEHVGAHCLGYNDKSIGICLIGKKVFTSSQHAALLGLLRILMAEHHIPVANILGHCETESGKAEGKTCPNLDMAKVRESVAI